MPKYNVKFLLDDGVVLPAQKESLIKHSTFFAAMFNSNYKFKEQQTTDEPIVLSQIPSQVFQVILHYAHTMQLPWMEPEEGLSLRPWAHYFGMEGLEHEAEKLAAKTLEPATVCSMWMAAEREKAHTLSALCQKFVEDRFGEVCHHASFLLLPKDLLRRALYSGRIGCEDEVVWRAVMNWGRFQALRTGQGADPEQIRSIVIDLLPPAVLFNKRTKDCILYGASRNPAFFV